VALSDDRVMVIGGDIVESTTEPGVGLPARATAELYDPGAGAFARTGRPQVRRHSPSAVLLRDGRVLVVGGYTVEGGQPVGDAEIYDPASETFALTGSMTAARFITSLTLLGDGRVLVVGGTVAAGDRFIPSADLYDPARETFVAAGSADDLAVPASDRQYPGRTWGPAIRLQDGRALLPGLHCQEIQSLDGGRGEGFDPSPSRIFDPVPSRFEPGPTAPHCVERAALLADGRVFLVSFWPEQLATQDQSGRTAKEVHWSGTLDPGTSEIRETATPPGGRYMKVAALPDGRVLVIGQRVTNDDESGGSLVAELFE
jgi:hypothetical protein